MTDKKLANIVINDVLRHYKRCRCVPGDVDAEFLTKLVFLVERGYVSRNVLKDSDLWNSVIESRESGSRSMLFHVFDSEFFLARDFFDEVVHQLR